MLHNPFSASGPTRPTIQVPGFSPSPKPELFIESFSDARTHGYRGPNRTVLLKGASSSGGGAISKNESGDRCAVVGRESLRILRISEPSEKSFSDHKHAIGEGGHRIDASKNLWSGTGLKIDSALTDVAWCQKQFDTKILTSAKNGELIVWDLGKGGATKLERRIKEHNRAINKISLSQVFPHYFITASSDGRLRLWDLRDYTRPSVTIVHAFGVRSAIMCPSVQTPLYAITGMDNGTINSWDLRSGQKGSMDKISLAHIGPVLSLDWCNPRASEGGWVASAGLDRTVKVWDFSISNDTNQPSSSGGQNYPTRRPTYTLHASFPIRRVAWRPGYEMELAIASTFESGFSLNPSITSSASIGAHSHIIDGSEGTTGSATGGSVDSGLTTSAVSDAMVHASRTLASPAGDMIEIWDVRRQWIAKWTVTGSNREGGVTDMTFADSHALWVQHPSGAFSQMDLRNCGKPIDAVPRTALTWTPSGSLTFVNGHKEQWEVPYDDLTPSTNEGFRERVEFHKKLGDKPFISKSQAVGTVSDVSDAEYWQMFECLARGYKLEGGDRKRLCEINSEVAFDAGHPEAGGIWLLVQSLLTDIIQKPPTPPYSPKTPMPALPHSTSAPAGVPSLTKSPNILVPMRSSSSEAQTQRSHVLFTTSSDGKQRSEIIMSNSSAAGHSLHSPLSPVSSPGTGKSIGPETSVSQDLGKKPRRQSVSVAILGRPRRTSLRRASMHVPSKDETMSPSSSVRRSIPSQIGEGALDDSESDSAEGSVPDTSAGRLSSQNSVLGSTVVGSPSTNSLTPLRLPERGVSSPLNRDDSNEWAEDERDDDSVSPASSESESDSSDASTTAARSFSIKRYSRPSRSRSSTIAALAADEFPPPGSISRHDSQNSIQTILGDNAQQSIDTRCSQSKGDLPSLASEIAVDRASVSVSLKTRKRRSQAFSINSVHHSVVDKEREGRVVDESEMRFLEHNHIAIREAEAHYRETSWNALREIVEEFAQKGDIQMCAMLACVASQELQIQPWRRVQFVESYVDLLVRWRMHTTAAYVRKYSISAEVRQTTQIQTTVYSSCGKCRKPILQPTKMIADGRGRQKTGYGFCTDCKRTPIDCAICHLPVRFALFVCGKCSHGGHRSCYEHYCDRRPMTEVEQLLPEQRGRSLSRRSASNSRAATSSVLGSDGILVTSPEDGSIAKNMGRPCAAGCGHLCWTSNGIDMVSEPRE